MQNSGTIAEVTYHRNEPFDIDNPPDSPDSFTENIIGLGREQKNRSSYENKEEEIYDPKKKKVTKKKSSNSVTRWLSKHHPFKCCFGGGVEKGSKFEFDQPNTEVFDI